MHEIYKIRLQHRSPYNRRLCERYAPVSWPSPFSGRTTATVVWAGSHCSRWAKHSAAKPKRRHIRGRGKSTQSSSIGRVHGVWRFAYPIWMLGFERARRVLGQRLIITGLAKCILYAERGRPVRRHIARDFRLATVREQCVECRRQIFGEFAVLGYDVRARRQYDVARTLEF